MMQNIKASSLIVLLLCIATVPGCDRNAQENDKLRVIELRAENVRLGKQLSRLDKAVNELQNNKFGQTKERIIEQPAKFKGGAETLQNVRDLKTLRCGGNADLLGFGYLSPESSEFIGFDIDFCRAIAAATLGVDGAAQIEIIPLTSKLRFAALQSGAVEVLTRNTTWTLSRDAELRTDYAGISFYDGQGIMVRTDSDIKKISDLRNKSICVQAGSTSASNIADHFENIGLNIELLEFADRVAALDQYDEGGCDAYTADKSSLISQRALISQPKDHQVLNEVISREPLGPVVRHGDENWKDIVNWTLQCMLSAEALEVNQDNVDEFLASELTEVSLLLGSTGNLGETMGLSNDFCYQVIRQVGNYADVYDRHLGPHTQLKLLRGLNALYTDGGLHYPLPFK